MLIASKAWGLQVLQGDQILVRNQPCGGERGEYFTCGLKMAINKIQVSKYTSLLWALEEELSGLQESCSPLSPAVLCRYSLSLAQGGHCPCIISQQTSKHLWYFQHPTVFIAMQGLSALGCVPLKNLCKEFNPAICFLVLSIFLNHGTSLHYPLTLAYISI